MKQEEIICKANETIAAINQTLEWLNVNHEDQYKRQFYDLTYKKLELRSMIETLSEKPGIAAYGESQKGKSYLMSNLLQDNGKPFMVVGPDKEYNYVTQLNPPGDGQEATGVVTRFTAYTTDPDRYCAQYPVLMKVLRIYELVCILSDAYYQDVKDCKLWSDKELEELSENIKNRYDSSLATQTNIIAEDILSIKKYLSTYVNQAQSIYRSEYLDTLSKVIKYVPQSDWGEVFSPLWHSNPVVTILFVKLINALSELKFSEQVYLSIDAIEHLQDKPRTIMSVQCLHGIYRNDFPHKTDVYLRNDGKYSVIKDFNRSLLAALCREIVLKVEDQFLNCDMNYNLDMIPDKVIRRIPRKTFKRDLLNHADLLDFPGARNREMLLEDNLDKIDIATKEHNMTKLLLRGKIAYLFNHYNSSKAINLLMFCQDTANIGVTSMYIVLNEWIKTYVGATPIERKKTIQKCGNIPPFFVISTKFNCSMVENLQDPDKNTPSALNQRWKNRFYLLYKDFFHAGTDTDWFNSWDAENSVFKNTYILRDFKYSARGGEGSNLYEGFCPTHLKEDSLVISQSHYNSLRETFINHDEVKKFLSDPELTWDVTSSMNNDGSVYIIDKLTIVAAHLASLRDDQLSAVLQDIVKQLYRLTDSYYIDPKGRDVIKETRKKVGALRLSFDVACNSDNYFYGRLIESLQISVGDSYHTVQQALNDYSLIEEVHDSHHWEIIKRRISQCKDLEEAYAILMSDYGCDSIEELKATTKSLGINIEELLDSKKGSPNISDVLAERVFKAWSDKLANIREIKGSLDMASWGIVIQRLIAVAESVHLIDVMASRIASLTDVNNLTIVNQYKVSDILASTLNEFVKDWGYSYILPDKLAKCRKIDEEHMFNIFGVIEKESQETFDEDSLTHLFSRLTSESKGLSEAFYQNYIKWFSFLTLGFLQAEMESGVVIDNVEANTLIGKVRDSLQL
jgi:hypothetical protein